MKRRAWTTPELDRVRREYGTRPAADLARDLRRSLRAVYFAAHKLGLMRCYKGRLPGLAAFVREQVAAGATDTDIAQAWGCERHAISRRRKVMGLPGNARGERFLARIRAGMRRQCAAAGVASLGAVRQQVFRRRAAAAGWPDDLRPRAVQILGLLWDAGPMTRRELSDAMGLRWLGSRKSLHSNDVEGSYLAHLMARGLVVCMGRLAKGKGKGGSRCVYALPLGIERKVG